MSVYYEYLFCIYKHVYIKYFIIIIIGIIYKHCEQMFILDAINHN